MVIIRIQQADIWRLRGSEDGALLVYDNAIHGHAVALEEPVEFGRGADAEAIEHAWAEAVDEQ